MFPLAVQYLDRYMAHYVVDTSSLQLLSTVCMLLASKLREAVPLSATKLCIYTDNAVSLTQLLVILIKSWLSYHQFDWFMKSKHFANICTSDAFRDNTDSPALNEECKEDPPHPRSLSVYTGSNKQG